MIQDIISSSTILLYIIPIIAFINTHNVVHIIGLLGLIGTVGLSEFIKYYIIGNKNPRPSGASNCNLLCNDGNQGGRPGMPSSHSATIGFLIGFYYQQTNNTIQIGILIYGALVLLSRYIKQCHTFEQIVVGTLFGLFCGFFAMRLFKCLKNSLC